MSIGSRFICPTKSTGYIVQANQTYWCYKLSQKWKHQITPTDHRDTVYISFSVQKGQAVYILHCKHILVLSS